jgi:hypothetical protein
MVTMKRIIASILAALVVSALAWIAGFDFDARGRDAFSVALLALSAAIFAYIF